MSEHAHNFINLEGETFGEVRVLEFVERKRRHTLWRCLCSCGLEFTESTSNLRSGVVRRCKACRLRLLPLRGRIAQSAAKLKAARKK